MVRGAGAAVLTLLFPVLLLAQANATKPTLAISAVTSTSVSAEKLEVVYSYVLDRVHRTGMYTVVERAEIEKALAELEISSSDLVDASSAAKVGKLVGAKALLFSSLTLTEGTYFLSMRVVQTDTGEVTRTSAKKTDSFERIEQLTGEAVDYLLGLEKKGRFAPKGNRFEVVAAGAYTKPLGVFGDLVGAFVGGTLEVEMVALDFGPLALSVVAEGTYAYHPGISVAMGGGALHVAGGGAGVGVGIPLGRNGPLSIHVTAAGGYGRSILVSPALEGLQQSEDPLLLGRAEVRLTLAKHLVIAAGVSYLGVLYVGGALHDIQAGGGIGVGF
jgi:hypothetical protein